MKRAPKKKEAEVAPTPTPDKPITRGQAFGLLTKPTADFTRALATEIVKNLTSLGKITAHPFGRRNKTGEEKKQPQLGEYPVLVDTSVLIDGRLLPVVNSGLLVGTLLVPQFVLGEVQHIADSADTLRRAKGRRGLEVAGKLRGQKANPLVKTKILSEDAPDVIEVDHKLIALIKRWKNLPAGRQARLITVDFNLAQLARTQGIKVLNLNDLAQALKPAMIAGEEVSVKITHEGKEREQGVGYMSDGTMIVVDRAQDKVGVEVVVVVTKVHQTPAGQLFFARLK